MHARPYFERALENARAAGSDALAVDAAHMIAITFLSSPSEAVRWNDRAIELALASSDPRARRWLGSLLNNKGWAYFEEKRFHDALDVFQEALAERRGGTDVRARRVANWAVARTLRALGKVQEALTIQERLQREYEEAGEKSGFVFEELGECHLALGNPEEATSWFRAAHEELSKNPALVRNEAARLNRISNLAGK